MKSWLMGVAGLAALALSSGAQAASSIDVDNLVVPPNGVYGTFFFADSGFEGGQPSGRALSQTWTVGKTGKLDRVDLVTVAVGRESLDGVTFDYDKDFSITLTILRGGTASAPGGVQVASISKMSSEIGKSGFLGFDLGDQAFSASAGDILTWTMSVGSCPEIYFCSRIWGNLYSFNDGSTSNGYAGGSMFAMGRDGPVIVPAHDLNFRTWMSAVPEPTTWAMMIVGFGLAGATLRRGSKPAVEAQVV